jgi:outer membrane biosynthesis protein TonB
MRLIGAISTAVLSLIIAVPAYAQQEQHDQQEEQKARPAQDEKKAQPEKSAKPGDKNVQQEEKNTQQQDRNKNQEEKSAQQQDKNNKQEEKNAQQQERNNQQENRNAQQRSQPSEPAQQAQHGNVGRIPDDRYRANFGQEHRFRVSQSDYSNRRFQYGGYSFGFVDAWPSNWLYTQDVFVVEIDGVYYLCNASYPGVNIELSFTE